MNNIESAVSCFRNTKFNCAQAVISTYGPKFGTDRELCLKISEVLVGGIASICGAVAGALMVIGLAHGRVKDDDLKARKKATNVADEFIKRFKAHHNTIMCKELINFDLSTEEQRNLATEALFENCPGFIKDAANLIEEILEVPVH